MKGSEFVTRVDGMNMAAREAEVLAALSSHTAWPLVDVALTWGGHSGLISVAADYFSMGDVSDFVRVPLSPLGAQKVADLLDLRLVTPRVVDAIWRAAAVRLKPIPMGPPYDASMMSAQRFAKHNALIEAARNGHTGLVAGHKKDVVLSERLAARPSQVAIYGWQLSNGTPIQPLSLVHENTYADYSHGIRFMSPRMRIDGSEVSVASVLGSTELAGMLSGEGAMTVLRVPGVPEPGITAPGGSLAARALQVAEQELAKGVREVPKGSNTGPQVRTYLLGCQRGGKPLGLQVGNWCAAFASYCAFQAVQAGEHPPHGWRAAVAELWADAMASGATCPPSYRPKLGDLGIYGRSGGDPTKGGIGHVGRVAREVDASGKYDTIEGNHDDAVARVTRTFGDALGWIEYPRAGAAEPKVDEGTLVAAAELLTAAPESDG